MFAIILFSGCACKPTIVQKVVKVNVPIKCKIPTVDCIYTGNDSEVVSQMVGCIYELKQASKVCQ